MPGLTGYAGSRLVPVVNQYYAEGEFHYFSNGAVIRIISTDDSDYEEFTAIAREELAPLTTDTVVTFSSKSEDWLVYLVVEEYGSAGTMDAVYSLPLEKMIFTGSIFDASPDCSAIYLSSYERIPLAPAELYNILRQFEHTGVLLEEDINTTGLGVFR